MSSGHIFIGELIGTAVLVLLGGGVCAAVTLKKSKAQNAGWLAITFGWGFAVLAGAYISNGYSGGQLNPAVTIGVAIKTGDWSKVPVYLAGQLLGAMIGAFLVWVAYYGHFKAHLTDPEVVEAGRGADPAGPVTKDGDNPGGPVLGVFSTGPEIRNVWQNLATEIIATTVLVLFILTQGMTKELALNGLGILLVALTVVGLGLSLGGPTGYAINPVRDLGPRIVHALLPLPNKGGSDWGYAWIPVVGPLVGGALAGGIYQLAFA
ncbi:MULTISPECIES: MIP/aquaporin family protein [Streptomycetaceae]|uniref:Glycerol uptake facilitator protein n=1 Tax=Streptantibioticus cattleyicolor (strain ATCC 35852 / DSM 46488 / JCM 4925 / NBRC 14057 / NRRL 8057) TaxID=1003195 RepID=F8K2K6_STREN|nr:MULTISPECIES: MIP/aquaporin family protein [Streptomycetaceae]AEW97517.1 glycerol uptake facilitator protein [Streptantibioticus cattleyicolor NRRL 8057 = DSM 46488]MYS61950.1 aquaporin family protein [Streptomyces sp. SID5468]CCB77841.1 glycerol permease [Streptantibioticus cattleyicolor NRRL 8057 = DSM 46488]